MGDILTVPRTEPLWDTDLFWPPQQPYGEGAAFPTSANGRFAGSSFNAFWSAVQGAAANNMQRYHDAICGAFTQGGGAFSRRAMLNAAAIPYLFRHGLTGSYKVPSWRRCYIWEFVVAWNVDAANTPASGIALQISDGTLTGWVTAVPGFGIVRNGAGVWEYRSYKFVGGVITLVETVPLVWPVAVTEFATVQFIIQSASGGGDATFQLRVNGVNALGTAGRSFGGGLLQTYDTGGFGLVNSACFAPSVSAGDTVVGGILYIGNVRFRAGAFDPDGNPV